MIGIRDGFMLCSFAPTGAAASAIGGGGSLAAGLGGAAETFGISMLPAVAQFIAGKVGQGRKAADGLTKGGLQDQFYQQVLVPLAELRKTNPQAAAAQMEPAWAAFQQQAQQYGAKDGNTAKVVAQMFSTPEFMNTVASILGRDPKSAAPAQQQQAAAPPAQTQQQNYAANPPAAQQTGGNLYSNLGQLGGNLLGALTNRGNPYQSQFQFPTTTLPTQAGSALQGKTGGGGILGGIGKALGGLLGGSNAGGTGGSGGSGGSSTNSININNTLPAAAPDTTPWDKILPALAGIGTKVTGDVLSADAMNKKNQALTAQAALMSGKANQQQQQRNYYASALMPSILQGLGNRNPNQIQQASQQMNTAKFPTS